MKNVYECEILCNENVGSGIYKMELKGYGELLSSKPGQFLHIKAGGKSLRRPISISGIKGEKLIIYYDVKGEGTAFFTRLKVGESLDLLGPLGNGFKICDGKKYLLIGGGLGAAPLRFAAQNGKCDAALGFKSREYVVLEEEYRSLCGEVFIATDDGSYGVEGFISEVAKKRLNEARYDGILACGPLPLLKKVKKIGEEFKTDTQISMEERMACGVGACLVCVCKTEKAGEEADFKRVCCDGPVFDAREVMNDE